MKRLIPSSYEEIQMASERRDGLIARLNIVKHCNVNFGNIKIVEGDRVMTLEQSVQPKPAPVEQVEQLPVVAEAESITRAAAMVTQETERVLSEQDRRLMEAKQAVAHEFTLLT